MFEKFFGSKSPEERAKELAHKQEREVRNVISKTLQAGVNGPAIHIAFKDAREKSQKGQYGMTDDQILNMVRDGAVAYSGPIEDSMYGGIEQTMGNIVNEIEKIRAELVTKKEEK